MRGKIVTKFNIVRKETDDALEWFPELAKLFENFNIDEITIKVKGSTDTYVLKFEEDPDAK